MDMISTPKKILLLTPPYHCGVVEVAGTWMPLNLAYLAGSAREAGYEVALSDAMSLFHDVKHIRKTIQSVQPDIVALTCVTSSFPAALSAARAAKEVNPNIKTILGGVHPTFCHKEILENYPDAVDFVVRGEGEKTFYNLLTGFKNGGIHNVHGISFHDNGSITVNPAAPFIHDLDTLEPAWDTLSWPIYTYYVFPDSRLGVLDTSRGCLHGCSFCSQQKFWNKRWRAKSPRRVVEQIKLLHKTYGVNVLLLSDEYPTADRARWEELLDRLIDEKLPVVLLMETRADDIVRDKNILRKYRRAGILHVYIGVESVTQETLDKFNKNLQVEISREALCLLNDAGMITETSFVLGAPWETKESIAQTLKLAQYYDPDFAHFLALAPWPYADLHAGMEPFIKTMDYSKYNLVEAVIEPETMTIQEVNEAIVLCYKKFYMNRMKHFDAYKDPLKRKYFLSSMKLIMKSSFLRKYMKGLGKMPRAIEKNALQESALDIKALAKESRDEKKTNSVPCPALILQK